MQTVLPEPNDTTIKIDLKEYLHYLIIEKSEKRKIKIPCVNESIAQRVLSNLMRKK